MFQLSGVHHIWLPYLAFLAVRVGSFAEFQVLVCCRPLPMCDVFRVQGLASLFEEVTGHGMLSPGLKDSVRLCARRKCLGRVTRKHIAYIAVKPKPCSRTRHKPDARQRNWSPTLTLELCPQLCLPLVFVKPWKPYNMHLKIVAYG